MGRGDTKRDRGGGGGHFKGVLEKGEGLERKMEMEKGRKEVRKGEREDRRKCSLKF